MPMFRKKPVVIEAWQWNGEPAGEMPGVCQCDSNRVPHLHTAHENSVDDRGQLVFLTKGDWIIPEAKKEGRYYPCKPDVFAETYEPAEAAYKPVASPPPAKCGYCDAMVVDPCGSRAQSQQCDLPPGTEFKISMGRGSDAMTMFGRRVLGKTEFDPPRVVMPELTPEQQKAFEEEWMKPHPGHITWLDDAPAPYRGEPIGIGMPIAEDDPCHPNNRHQRFIEALSNAVNSCSMENGSNTPDFLLGQFLADVLRAMDAAMTARAKWYGGDITYWKGRLEAEGAHTEAANAEIERLKKRISDLENDP